MRDLAQVFEFTSLFFAQDAAILASYSDEFGPSDCSLIIHGGFEARVSRDAHRSGDQGANLINH